jgi:hypothetical protein
MDRAHLTINDPTFDNSHEVDIEWLLPGPERVKERAGTVGDPDAPSCLMALNFVIAQSVVSSISTKT